MKKQLEEKKAVALHTLMVALGKSHPDLATIDMQDKLIQRLDRALFYLEHYYPPKGYGLEEEEPSSPKVLQFMKKLMPKVTLPPKPDEPPAP